MYSLEKLPAELLAGAEEICKMLEIPVGCNGKPITAKDGDMSVEITGEAVNITYKTKPQFFRMLSMLTGKSTEIL